MPGYTKALILAGGKGTRLRRLGEVIPKCMVPIYDQPLLLHQITQCIRAGIQEITICIAKEFAPFIDVVLSRYRPPAGLRIHTKVEERPLGPIQGFISLIPILRDSASILMLGDMYHENHAPFDRLKTGLLEDEMVLGVAKTRDRNKIGCMVTTNAFGKVEMIKDKPSSEEIRGNLEWCGFVAFHPGVLERADRAVKENKVPGRYIGDLFEGIRRLGTTVGVLEFSDVQLNLNRVDDVLLATLLEARKNWLREKPERIADLDQAIAALFRSK